MITYKIARSTYWCIILPIVFLMSLSTFAQPIKKVDVGIQEHLDDTIPLQLTFFNEQGELVTLGQYINKPTVLSFVYFDCPGLCNPLLDGINEVIGKVDLQLGKDFDVVTISFNPGDSYLKAVDKKKNFSTNLTESNAQYWNYLVGNDTNVNAILDALGFHIKKVGVDYMHPSAIMLISPQGKITRYLYGTYFLPFDLKMAVSEASQGISRPTISRVLEYCFSYDPQGQKYKLQITKVSATIIIFLAVLLLVILMLKPKKKTNLRSDN